MHNICVLSVVIIKTDDDDDDDDVRNFTPIGAQDGYAACKSRVENFHVLVKIRSVEANDRFPELLGAFICQSTLHKCFKFHLIRFTGYGVVAEKPCVGHLCQIMLLRLDALSPYLTELRHCAINLRRKIGKNMRIFTDFCYHSHRIFELRLVCN